jgi:hypothetical protein
MGTSNFKGARLKKPQKKINAWNQIGMRIRGFSTPVLQVTKAYTVRVVKYFLRMGLPNRKRNRERGPQGLKVVEMRSP